MAQYYVDRNGNITTKKKKSKYRVGLDGKVILNEVDEKKEKWYENIFKSGAFGDDKGNIFTDALLSGASTIADAGIGIAKGGAGLVEGVTDLGLYGISGAANMLGADKLATGAKNLAQKNSVDKALSGLEETVDKYSFLDHKADNVSQGLGYVSGILLTGGVGASAGLGALGTTALTTGTTFGSSMGSGMSEAYQAEATDKEAMTYGLVKGVVEAGSELLFGGLGKAVKATGLNYGISNLDDLLAKKLGNLTTNKLAQNMIEYGIKSGAEGVEELVAGVGSAYAKKLSYMKDEDIIKLLEDEKLAEQFVTGAITSAIAQSGYVPAMKNGSLKEANKTGRDFITGYTQNEQKVIDKVVEDRVAQAEIDGNKLSNKEKGKILEEVESDLKKGYIDLNSIESALGGDTYINYKTITDKETKLQEEIKTLENMPSSQITVRQSERLQEARKELTNLQQNSNKSEIKDRLSKEVSDLTLNDTFIRESYNEKGRRSLKYEADLSKYDEKQKVIVKRAVDSGILNNTNRTHELVDMIAKISADKGVLFDFTNNENLRKSGFALDGKTINGYVKDGNITVNMDSNKYLNTVVGHEVTHILEGTELYTELQQAVKEYATAKGEYDTRLQSLTKMYQGIKGANIENELTADLVGEYLFTDTDFISNLSTGKPNVFKKIYEEIKYLWKVATAGSKEAKQLEKMKRAFDKAYRITANTNGNINTKFSLEDIANMTEKSYNHHGWAKVNEVLSDIELADFQTKVGIRKNQRGKWYLDLGNGRQMFAVGEEGINSTLIISDGKFNAPSIEKVYHIGLNNETDIEIVRDVIYEREKNWKRSLQSETIKDYFPDGIVELYGQSDFADYQTLRNEYGSVRKEGKGNIRSNSKLQDGRGSNTETQPKYSVSDKASSKDGVFFDAENTKYSISEDTKGRTLTKEQQEYFKDSKVVDENGNLIVVYHGTRNADFTVFKRNQNYFTDSEEMADSYAPTSEKFEGYLDIKNPFIVDAEGEKWSRIAVDNDLLELLRQNGASVFEEDGEWRTSVADIVSMIEEGVDEGEYDYDGVIIRNVDDTGDYYKGRESIISNDYIVFKSSQFKNTDNTKPTSNPDIRYSLSDDTNIKSVDDIETKYKDKTDYLFLYEKDNTISIDNMVVKKEYRNQGIGTQILNDVISYADKTGKTITLTPTSEFGTKEKLKKWYKANGFVENKGRNTDFLIRDTMYRLPQSDNTRYSLSDVYGFKVNDKANINESLLEELSIHDPEAEVDENGDVTVYHRTSVANANEIKRTGIMKAQEDALFFSSKDSGYASDYGEAVVKLKIPSTVLEVNDIFDGEVHFDIPLKYKNGGFQLDVRKYLYDDTKFSLSDDSKEHDSAYMSAVEQGDMETAQKLVEETARKYGYNTKAYHGTLTKGITEFKKEFIGSRYAYDDVGFFFTDNLNIAKSYSRSEFNADVKGEVISAYIKTDNALVFDEKYAMKNGYGRIFRDNDAIDVWDNYQSAILEEAEEINADSIIIKDGYSMMVVAFEPNQIKSAEPVTYDNEGNVIPLSERFNKNKNDIRYSLSEAAETLTDSQKELIRRTAKLTFMKGYGKDTYSVSAYDTNDNSLYDTFGSTKEELVQDWGEDIANEITSHKIDLMRYELDEKFLNIPADRDTNGKRLSENQREYFKNVVPELKDSNGNLKIVYHGSGSEFTEFSYDFMSTHGSSEGQGFYFTDKKEMAEGYRMNGVKLMEGYLNIQKPLSDAKITLKKPQVKKLLKTLDPTGDIILSDYESTGGVGYPSKSWYDRALQDTLNSLMSTNSSDSEILAEIANVGGGSEVVLKTVRKLFGYDGYIVEGKYDDATVYVAFESNQFKDIDNENPTDNPDINMSLSNQNEKLAPVRGWKVSGKDVRLENIAPVREMPTSIQANNIAPVRDGRTIPYRSNRKGGILSETDELDIALTDELAEIDRAREYVQIAEILNETPKKESTRNKRIRAILAANLLDKGFVFENLALHSPNKNDKRPKRKYNRELMAKWNYTLYSESRAQELIGNGNGEVKALNDIIAEVENTNRKKDFYQYMYHKHNVDRMSLKERYDTDNKPVFGDAITAQVSQEIADKYEKIYPEFKTFAKDVYDYMSYLRQQLVDNGVINKDTAKLWSEMYPHYVPVGRVDSKGLNINVPLDTGRTGINAPVKKATGGSSNILPLFDTMAARTLQTYKATAKNSFGIELKNTLNSVVDNGEVTVDEVIDNIDAQEGLLQEGKNGQNPTFTVFENGERVTFEITKDMYDALKPVSESSILSKNIPFAGAFSNFRRGVITEFNPVFMLTNPIKDIQDVLLNSQHPAKTYAKIPEAFVQMKKKGYWYTEYINNGGSQNSFFDSETGTFKTENKGLASILEKPPFKWISSLNQTIEMLPRLAEYIASREAGDSVEVAMLDSARVTTNFRAGGDVTKFLNRNGCTFLNASVQGAMQQIRNLREAKANGKKGMANLITKFAIAGLPAVILNHLIWDEDEDYEELSDYVKQNYYVVWKNDDGQFVRVPKGRALAVIQDAITQVSNASTGNDEADLGAFLKLVVDNIAPANPVDNNIIAPIMQVLKNKTWYGEDLVPERLQDLPEAEQFDESTDSISKWVGEKLNISPVKVNYLLDQYSGGVGDMILPMFTPEAENGSDSVADKILIAPIRDKFTTNSVMNNQNVSDFYDMSEELTKNANSSKATDEDILKNKYFTTMKTTISDLYKQKREVQSSDMKDSEKYKEVMRIQEEINELAKEALNEYTNVTVDGAYAIAGGVEFKINSDGAWEKIDKNEKENQEEAITKLGITPAEYWSNSTANNYATNYPEKYAISQALGGYETYKSYTKEINKCEADKDENGKVIAGSRKEKVINYINNLDMDYGEKAILFKSVYSADDTYNMEIVEYLNSREDISYSQMVEILKALGFEVSSDGTVSW